MFLSILRGFGLKLVGLNPSCAIETFLPIGFAHVVDTHGFARSRGVNEFAVANVDADMAEGAFHGVEEHQVTWLEFTAVSYTHLTLPTKRIV